MSAALIAILALAAHPPVAGCADLSGQPIHIGIQWPTVWQALNTQSGCTQNCHLGGAPAAGLNLSNQRFSQLFLVGQTSAQGKALLVEPGEPTQSLLFNKINCSDPGTGAPMPPGGGLSPSLQGMIYDWIEQGAYGESQEDMLARDFVFRGDFESLRAPR